MPGEIVMSVGNLLLDLNKIRWQHEGRTVLDGVDLKLHRGEILTVIGPNGAGKSCLIRIALGLLKPSGGQRWIAPNLRVGYLPQTLKLNPYLPMTVADFLALPAAQGKPFSQQDMLAALAEVGAEHLLRLPAQSLSGGEQQRVLLARALLRQPDLLVLDEPVQGVDLAGQAELYALIASLRDRYHCGVLMVSHDLHVVMAATDRVLCLNGHVCCTGHPEAVSRHPEYQRLFGVQESRDLAIYTHHHDHHHTLHGDATRCNESCQHD